MHYLLPKKRVWLSHRRTWRTFVLFCTLVLTPLASSRAAPAPITPPPPFAGRATVVADLETDPEYLPSDSRDFIGNGTFVFFTAHTSSGRELWRIDDSGSAALLVADIRKGFASSEPTNLTSIGSEISTLLMVSATIASNTQYPAGVVVRPVRA